MKAINFIILILATLTIFNSCSKKIQAEKSSVQGFEISKIDKRLENELRQKGVFSDASPVPINRLVLLKIKYLGFDQQEHSGEMIVLDACSQAVIDIFKELYDNKFPIEKMNLMTQYNGNDSISMADNNTSAHNLRLVTGGKSLSLHAYGTAIDLNPLINPFVTFIDTLVLDPTRLPGDTLFGIARYSPVAGIHYANRKPIRLGKANRIGLAEDAIHIFAKHGFYYWGGYWDKPIDYQHFQISRSLTEVLIMMNAEAAAKLFKQSENFYNKTKVPIEEKIEEEMNGLGLKKKSISAFYKDNPDLFEAVLKKMKV